MKLRDKYRKVFVETMMGQEVWTDLMIRLHDFDEITIKPAWRRWFRDRNEEIVLQNFAKRLKRIVGIYESRNALEITQALFRLPVGQDETEEK